MDDYEQVRHELELIKVRLDATEGDARQLWTFVRVYFTERGPRVGNIQLSKKTVAGLLFSIAIGLINFALRLFDII